MNDFAGIIQVQLIPVAAAVTVAAAAPVAVVTMNLIHGPLYSIGRLASVELVCRL